MNDELYDEDGSINRGLLPRAFANDDSEYVGVQFGAAAPTIESTIQYLSIGRAERLRDEITDAIEQIEGDG